MTTDAYSVVYGDVMPEKVKDAKPEERKSGMSIIRIAETNLDGGKKVKFAIRNVSGISFMFANAVSEVSGLGDKLIGELTEDEQKKLTELFYESQRDFLRKRKFLRL